MLITKVSLLLLVVANVNSPIVFAESNSEVITTKESNCTVDQRAELILLGLSRKEIDERCSSSTTSTPSITVNINNSNINENNNNNEGANANVSSRADTARLLPHEPEIFFLKFGIGPYSTSFLNDECADCETNDFGMDFFSFRYYSNSLQPGSLGLHLNWAQFLPSFSTEYENVDVYTPDDNSDELIYRGNYSYTLDYFNMARFVGIEYIFGNDASSFYPGVAILFGSLQQNMEVFECTEGDDASTISENSYCLEVEDSDTQTTSVSGFSISLYSSKIAKKGSGISVGLTYLNSEDNDETVDFATTGLEVSGIW